MELRAYSDGDLALTQALECDPDVMSELGGPVDRAQILEIHRRRLKAVADVDWWFKIVPEVRGPPAGVIGVWESTWNGSTIHEIGWMVLPRFQGRGVASRALGMVLSRARSEPRIERLHAFPSITNDPSNALCRRFGFSMTEECDVQFRDRTLRCNHWVLRVDKSA